jgi:hypothetical protein
MMAGLLLKCAEQVAWLVNPATCAVIQYDPVYAHVASNMTSSYACLQCMVTHGTALVASGSAFE